VGGGAAPARGTRAALDRPPGGTTDGLYWTGDDYAAGRVWPRERTAWNAGSVLLANAALTGNRPTRTIFAGTTLPHGLDPNTDPTTDCCA
jgi:hypothetical protein